MGVGAGLYMCDVVKKSSRSLSHLPMSSCTNGGPITTIMSFSHSHSMPVGIMYVGSFGSLVRP